MTLLLYFLLIVIFTSKFVLPECEKSFVMICESVVDVGFDKTKSSWTELLIQKNIYQDSPAQYTLSGRDLTRDLENLKWLVIVKQLRKIDKSAFTYLKQLKHLVFYDNDFEDIETRSFVGFIHLEKLGLENNNINNVKPKAFQTSTIDTVDLSHNKLKGFKSNVFRKCKVLELIVTHNRLSSIETNSLPNTLKILRLDFNNFFSWPEEISNLKELEQLTMSHNDLSAFDVSQNQRLKMLDLSFNQIETIREEFDHLQGLKYLDLSANQLKSFDFTPKFVKNIGEFFSLFLAYNRLRNVHLEALNSTSVTTTLCGNPWNCKCLEEMNKVIYRPSTNIIRTNCDKNLFNGKIPVCLETETKECREDEVTDDDFQLFRNLCNYQASCNVFTDKETYAH